MLQEFHLYLFTILKAKCIFKNLKLKIEKYVTVGIFKTITLIFFIDNIILSIFKKAQKLSREMNEKISRQGVDISNFDFYCQRHKY